jgi:hypothetical protein
MVEPKIHPRMIFSHLIANFISPLLTIVLQLLAILDAAGAIVGQVAAAIAQIRTNARPDSGANPSADARPVGDAASGTGRKLRWSIAGTRPRAIASQVASACGQLRWPIAAVLKEIAGCATGAWSRSTGRWAADVQEVVQLSGVWSASSGDVSGAGPSASRRTSCRPCARRCTRAGPAGPGTRSLRRPRSSARERWRSTAGGRRSRGSAAGPRASAPSGTATPAAAGTTAASATATTAAGKRFILHKKNKRRDEHQNGGDAFHKAPHNVLRVVDGLKRDPGRSSG